MLQTRKYTPPWDRTDASANPGRLSGDHSLWFPLPPPNQILPLPKSINDARLGFERALDKALTMI